MASKNHPFTLEEALILDQDPNPNDHTMQDILDDDDETVSLCDLPIYGSDTAYSSTSDSEDTVKGDETFEFFSEEWIKNDKNSNFFPPKEIVFCGNLIPPKQPISKNTSKFKKPDHGSTKIDPNSSGARKKELAKLISMNKGRIHGAELETKRVVFPGTGLKKPRWYNYGVGLAGNPMEMDLTAIRSRQDQRRKNRPEGGGGEEKESGGFRRGKGLSRLIRDLSCNSQNKANSMVKASLVYVPKG
ncbi:hypothetical protein OSB04_un001293 [Centaurea solstitialis]|uniref:Uncharacterized protein n=1 Tax=Centaurea solstitialis TaxID=347529 RepID=A0AA38SM15_9ASTR|nr:hypothetical protein OSB04_un001293 [Centaurea solstitialis]